MTIANEKRVVEKMIRLYCRKKEHNAELCAGCSELLTYACQRLERCRFDDQKPSCKRCPVHCYKPEMRAKIREVMRFSGPRMMLYHPIAAIKHLLGN